MYIVIETFDKTFPSIVTDEDGIPIVLKTKKQAELLSLELHQPIIVEI